MSTERILRGGGSTIAGGVFRGCGWHWNVPSSLSVEERTTISGWMMSWLHVIMRNWPGTMGGPIVQTATAGTASSSTDDGFAVLHVSKQANCLKSVRSVFYSKRLNNQVLLLNKMTLSRGMSGILLRHYLLIVSRCL